MGKRVNSTIIVFYSHNAKLFIFIHYKTNRHIFTKINFILSYNRPYRLGFIIQYDFCPGFYGLKNILFYFRELFLRTQRKEDFTGFSDDMLRRVQNKIHFTK